MDFILGKIFWMIAAPLNLLALLLLFTSFMALSHRREIKKKGCQACLILSLILVAIMILPVGDWLLCPLENRFKSSYPDKVEGILILGGDEDPAATEQFGQPVLQSSARRYLALAELAKRYPTAKIVFTGGYPDLTNPSKLTNGDVAKKIMSILGISETRVTIETQSRTTFENARDSALMIKPKPEHTWLLITSAHHMPRAMGAFRHFGWNVVAAPTDYLASPSHASYTFFDLRHHSAGLHIALREYFGLLAYWIGGKMDVLWPA